MTTRAWPFLMTRSKHASYRLVVVPGFMHNDKEARTALRAASGGVPELPRGEAAWRAVQAGDQEVCLIYRVFIARMHDYELGDDELITDYRDRPIEITEGVVLQCEGEACLRLQVGSDDLDRVHDAVQHHYQAFWREEEKFQPRQS